MRTRTNATTMSRSNKKGDAPRVGRDRVDCRHAGCMDDAEPAADAGGIGARFQVDRERIDLGNQVFDRPVRAVFTAKNIGDGTLKLEAPSVPTVLEGC